MNYHRLLQSQKTYWNWNFGYNMFCLSDLVLKLSHSYHFPERRVLLSRSRSWPSGIRKHPFTPAADLGVLLIEPARFLSHTESGSCCSCCCIPVYLPVWELHKWDTISASLTARDAAAPLQGLEPQAQRDGRGGWSGDGSGSSNDDNHSSY